MPDREKVINGLRSIKTYLASQAIETTDSFAREGFIESQKNIDDALALLKEQETQLQYRDDHIAEYEKEIKRLEKLLKEQDAVLAHWLDNAGHWIEGDRNDTTDPHKRVAGEMIDTFQCSWCGYYMYWKTPFCPNCGAKMTESGEVNG